MTNYVTVIEDIKETYEPTGEFRGPLEGELYLSDANRINQAFCNYPKDERRIILKSIVDSTHPPKGYVLLDDKYRGLRQFKEAMYCATFENVWKRVAMPDTFFNMSDIYAIPKDYVFVKEVTMREVCEKFGCDIKIVEEVKNDS